MNKHQAKAYASIKESYRSDPRWIAAREVLDDKSSSQDDYKWALSRCYDLKRAALRSAESARVGGL